MKKISLFLLSASILFVTSCNNDISENFSASTTSPDDVAIIDDGANISILKETVLENTYADVSDFMFDENNAIRLRSTQTGGPYTMVGYTGRKYIKTDKIGFGGSNPLGLSGYYLFDLYEYYYQITVPHGATLSIPSSPTDPKNMGCKDANKFIAGYVPVEGAKNSNGDTYYLTTTYVRIITHNISGQQVGPYYYPYQHPNHKPEQPAIKNPSTFIFKYAWSIIQW